MAIAGLEDSDIYIRDKSTCLYCGLSGMWNLGIWRQLEIDHIIPETKDKKEYGPNIPENKVVACHRCNNLKHGYDPSEGNPSIELSKENRQKLISKAREHIRDRAEAQREVEVFLQLMAETCT